MHVKKTTPKRKQNRTVINYNLHVSNSHTCVIACEIHTQQTTINNHSSKFIM